MSKSKSRQKLDKATALPPPSRLSRKEKRKQDRHLKKQVKQDNFRKFLSGKKSRKAYTGGRFVLAPRDGSVLPENTPNEQPQQSLGEKMRGEIAEMQKQQRVLEKEMRKQRRRHLADENEEEEKNIKKLEKLLKLNKRKNKSIPKSFAESGFDYILDVCDSSKVQAAVQAEMNLQESPSDFEEDLAVVTGKGQPKEGKFLKMKQKLPTDDLDGSCDDAFDVGSDESDDAPAEFSSRKGNAAMNHKSSNKNGPLEYLENSLQGDEDSDGCSRDEGSDESDDDPGLFGESSNDEITESEDDQLKSKSTTKRKASDAAGPKIKNQVKFNKLNENERDFDEDDEFSDNDFSDDAPKESDSGNEAKSKKSGLYEDIYGRIRDRYGNIVKDSSAKYVPPHLRDQPADDKKKAELEKLARNLKGLLNRLAENNMHSIANQVDELYMSHSRHDMNTTLLKQYLDSLVAPVLTPERLVMEHAMLIAVLHANVGSDVGAFFLQHLGKRFDEMHAVPTEIENKELDNLILLLCHMYTFKIFDSILLYDILHRLAEKFTPKDVDLILVVLRSVGFTLRKDNPLALKDFILKVQKLANNAGDMKNDSRVRFMLDVLLSIKNNNMSKIPQYDTTHSEHLKKAIKPMFRKGNYVTELKITLEEMLKADERGKWWVVGSAWSGPAPQQEKPKTRTAANSYTQEILELAKKHRMNTATRKNIFCILMTAEDYLDAFEKLLKLGLKGQPEQDIVNVLLHCLLSETTYNPYYAHIADKLCTSDRRHRMTIQYASWDRFKELKSHSNHQVTNLAKFLAHLFIKNSLPMSMLKTLEFTEMNNPCVRLLRQILLSLLLNEDREAMVAVFSRIAKPSRLQMFRESIRLFMHHFLLKNINDDETPEAVKLKDAISTAEQALMEFS